MPSASDDENSLLNPLQLVAVATTPPTFKRKRGRPRKSEQSPIVDNMPAIGSTSAGIAAGNREIGRPSKKRKVLGKESDDDSESIGDDSDASYVPEAVDMKPIRGRGRPKRDPSAQSKIFPSIFVYVV